MYTVELYNFINQCHPNKFSKKEKKIKPILYQMPYKLNIILRKFLCFKMDFFYCHITSVALFWFMFTLYIAFTFYYSYFATSLYPYLYFTCPYKEHIIGF